MDRGLLWGGRWGPNVRGSYLMRIKFTGELDAKLTGWPLLEGLRGFGEVLARRAQSQSARGRRATSSPAFSIWQAVAADDLWALLHHPGALRDQGISHADRGWIQPQGIHRSAPFKAFRQQCL